MEESALHGLPTGRYRLAFRQSEAAFPVMESPQNFPRFLATFFTAFFMTGFTTEALCP
jgi:hypothetical protein